MKRTWKGRALSLLLSAALLASLAPAAQAAGEEEPEDGGYSISFKPAENALEVNQSMTMEVTVSGGDGKLPDGMTVEWGTGYNGSQANGPVLGVEPDSANPLKATVTALRLLTTQEEPEGPVTVTAQLKRDDKIIDGTLIAWELDITNGEPSGLSIRLQGNNNNELEPNRTGTMQAVFSPEGAEEEPVTWSTASELVTLDPETGAVTAGQTPGTAVITARSESGLTAQCEITVRGITIDPAALTLRGSQSGHLEVEGYGQQVQSAVSRPANIQWSYDKSYFTIDGGYVYPLMTTDEKGETVTAAVLVNNQRYEASCTVTVVRGEANPIPASASTGSPLSFDGLVSRISSQCRAVLGSALDSVGGLSVPTSQGTLYYRYRSDSDTGLGVGSSERYYAYADPALSDVTFVPRSEFSGTASISYIGYDAAGGSFRGTIQVEVEAPEGLSYTTPADQPLQLSADDLNRICRAETGRELSEVTFTQPDSSRGTLYAGYRSPENHGDPADPARAYRRTGSPSLSDLYFVPNRAFQGQAVISYTARDVNGETFRGRITVRVTAPAGGGGDLSYSVAPGGALTMDEDDFNDLSREVTGNPVDYVRFELPDSAAGTLYYNYSAGRGDRVEEGDSYYRSASPYLRRVSFVAEEDFSGETDIPFTAWDTRGNRFSGTVEITVGETPAGDVTYTVRQNGSVTLDDSDFNALCRDATGETLSFLRFDELPRASQGELRYGGSSGGDVTTARRYYRASSPYLDRVTFRPDRDFTGTVSIPFTGESTGGASFAGQLVIRVEQGSDTISYTVRPGGVLTFDTGDFDALSRDLTGDRLSYVRFVLPEGDEGTLYYDYDEEDGYHSRVSASRSYYRSSSPYLDRVAFVPDRDFEGTVYVDFTGRSTGGDEFSGAVEIAVEAPSAPVIRYSTDYRAVSLRASDFADACREAGLDELESVRFESVGGTGGSLYRSDAGSGAAVQVRAGVSCYLDGSPSLSGISFVPRVGWQGTVTLPYTARDERGASLRGRVEITVRGSSASRYFSDLSSYAWAVPAVDYLYERGVVGGTGAGQFSPGAEITRGDFVLMLCQAFDLSGGGGTAFPDVPADSYYAAAISAAQALGVAGGYPDGSFRPQGAVTRQDAAVMLCKAMQAGGWSLGRGDLSLLNRFTDGSRVAPYAGDAVALLAEYGILSGTDQGALDPERTTTQAELAVMLAAALTM